MNFIERIKADLNEPKNRQGMREKVVVNAHALRKLLEHFETMDTAERALHPESRALEVNHQLHNLIEAAYHQQGKNAETTLMLVMSTLLPLMKERHKEQEAIHRFGG
jgi:aspartate carbamoyltransferase catalytic subunit